MKDKTFTAGLLTLYAALNPYMVMAIVGSKMPAGRDKFRPDAPTDVRTQPSIPEPGTMYQRRDRRLC